MPLVAHETLAKACLFVRQARNTSPNDREALAANFEAAVIFAGFYDWYQRVQEDLKADPLASFLLKQRNYVLKVGPAPTRRVVNVSVLETLEVSGEVSARVIRGQPWYRRSPKILVQDLLYPLRERVELLKRRRRARAQRRGPVVASAPPPTHELFFQEELWSDAPALDLLERQLNTLRRIVDDAASGFHAPERK